MIPQRALSRIGTGAALILLLATAQGQQPLREWTTAEGWKAFLGTDATLDLRPGGAFEILFAPPEAGEGQRGSEGCQVLAYVPDRMLTFSWSAPLEFPERAQRTWVTASFADAPKGAGTIVTVDQVGFGVGDGWAAVHTYFERAWDVVLSAEVAHHAPKK